MSTGSYKQVYVKCPFYKNDDGKSVIVCEGIVDRCVTKLAYKVKKDWETQIDVFCSCYYKNCEVYGMLMGKYKDDFSE